MRVGYSYSWFLPAGHLALVREVIDRLRQHAVELGGEAGDVRVLTGDDAQAVQPNALAAVLFTATLPGATEGRYGLAAAGISSWAWHGSVVSSDVRAVSQLHEAAAELGLEVAESYAGMVFTLKKNALGVVEGEQRWAFDGTDF